MKKTWAEELVALADRIKVLNDDDALEFIKKTLPSAASFIQLRVASTLRKRARLSMKVQRESSGYF